MGKGSSGGGSAPTPDPNIGLAALKQSETGQQWMAFARDAFKVSNARQADLDKLTAKVTNQQLGIAGKQAGMADWQFQQAKEDRARYKDKGYKAQAAFAKEASEYASPEKLKQAAAEAGAAVQQEAATSRETARREEAAMGIAPGSGRFAGTERAGQLGTATAVGGAKNNARTQRLDKALALKADVANMYSGLPAQSAQAASLGLSAGGGAAQIGAGAVGMGQNNQNLYQGSTSIMNSGYGGQMSGYAGMGAGLQNLHNSNLEAWRVKTEANSANQAGMWGGIGNIVGGIAGLAAVSDPKKKKNIKATKKGSGLEAVKKMPIKSFDYKTGEGDGGKGHIGTMSGNFARGIGQPDTGMIKFQDAIGITMKAIQDLDYKVDKLAAKGSKTAKPKTKAATARRPSQSPAKARPIKATASKAPVTARTLGIRRG